MKSYINTKPYLLDIVVGRGCNFRCKYCFEQNSETPYEDLAMSEEVLSLACDYTKHELELIPSDMKMRVCFFGGEPLLYINNINTAMENLIDTKALFNIVTNGSLITQNSDFFLNWKEKAGSRLLVNVSYDYSEQENYRQVGSYETVRNGIRYLSENGFSVRTITVVSANNIEKLPDILTDYQNLQKECPGLFGVLNLDYNSFSTLSWEDDVYPKVKILEEMSEQIKNMSFRRNDSCGIRGARFPENVHGRLHAGIDVNGDIYPGYSFCFDSEAVKNACYLGSVYDDYETLDAYRKELINALPQYASSDCTSCEVKCNYSPWHTIKTNITEYNKKPIDTICKLNMFLRVYL